MVVPLAVTGADLADAVAAAWQDALRHQDTADVPFLAPSLSVAVGDRGRADVVGATVHQTLHTLSTTVMRTAIAARSRELVMLEAVAVVDPDTGGAGVLVEPRRGGASRSLTSLGGGLAHLAAHTTGITPDGLVLAALDPIPTDSPATEAPRAPSAVGLRTASADAYPLAALLVLLHDPAHVGEPVVERIDTIDALAELADETESLHYLEAPLQRLVGVVRRAGGARRVTFAHADRLVPVVRECLAGAVT